MGNFHVQSGSSAQVSYVNRVCFNHDLHADMEMRILVNGQQCRATGRRRIYQDACLDVAGCGGIQEGQQFQIQFRQWEGKTVTAPSQHTYRQNGGGAVTYRATGDLVNGNAWVEKFRFDGRGVDQCNTFHGHNFCDERCGPGKFWPTCGVHTLESDDTNYWRNPQTGVNEFQNPSCEIFRGVINCDAYRCDCSGCGSCGPPN